MNFKLAAAMVVSAFLMGCGSGSGGSLSGDEGAKGGDVIAQKAALIVEDVVTRVSEMPEVFPEVNQSQLAAAAARVRILVKPKTYAHGVETDAVNNGFDVIELNISRWKKLSLYEHKLALLAHELFGLIGVERSANYNISRRIYVEGRFNSNRLYECLGASASGPAVKCTLRLRFDGAAHTFAIDDLNCNFPGIEGFGARRPYSYFSEKVYSTNNSCSYPINPGEEGSCSVSSPSGMEYDTLSFGSGYRFNFEGFLKQGVPQRVTCNAI